MFKRVDSQELVNCVLLQVIDLFDHSRLSDKLTKQTALPLKMKPLCSILRL